MEYTEFGSATVDDIVRRLGPRRGYTVVEYFMRSVRRRLRRIGQALRRGGDLPLRPPHGAGSPLAGLARREVMCTGDVRGTRKRREANQRPLSGIGRLGAVLFAACLLLGLAAGRPAAAAGQKPELYLGYCQACHMPNARGIRGLYPPLDRVVYFTPIPQGRAYLARVVLFGMLGPITVEGQTFRGYMPAFEGVLDDETLADLLNELVLYLTTDPGQAQRFTPYTPEEIARYRSQPSTANQIHRERQGVVDELVRRAMPVP